MINFPVLEHIDILNYGLYPGNNGSNDGLHIKFQPGLTLILGANGLGKTTLISIIYRLMTGPFDIPRLDEQSDLGNKKIAPSQLSSKVRSSFAARVMDGARNATARLTFRLGTKRVVVERHLNNLTLSQFIVDGEVLGTDEKETFQSHITELVGVSSFGDWLLLLRYLVFYFEDRRELVWDPSAQREIIRLLFLPSSRSKKWAEDIRSILELDSHMRNLRATVGKEERKLLRNEVKSEASIEVRSELDTLERLQSSDVELQESLNSQILEVDSMRQQARLRKLRAEQDYEGAFRGLERVRLISIGTKFPKQSESAKYILSQLLTDQNCLVCNSHVPDAVDFYSARINHQQCIICGSDLTSLDTTSEELLNSDEDDIATLSVKLEKATANLNESMSTLEEAEERYRSYLNQINELSLSVNERSRRIDHLIQQLPPEEAEIHEQRSALAALKGSVEGLKRKLASDREAFRRYINEVALEVVQYSEPIKESFNHYAKEFLLEECKLTWSPQKVKVGQEGSPIDFPAFELEMTGTNYLGLVRRSLPEEVSESQREFIDLAFRMALTSVAGNKAGTTLIVDAPESSLDAVFASRAADVLSHFADPALGNRLVVTSNLVEGSLIPGLIHKCITKAEQHERVVDLIKVAVPTAALRERRNEYEEIRDKLLDVT